MRLFIHTLNGSYMNKFTITLVILLSIITQKSFSSEDSPCPICLKEILKQEKTLTLSCRHSFHPECINEWTTVSSTCPVCRKAIQPTLFKRMKKKSYNLAVNLFLSIILYWPTCGLILTYSLTGTTNTTTT